MLHDNKKFSSLNCGRSCAAMVAIDSSSRGDEARGCVTCCVACSLERSLLHDNVGFSSLNGESSLAAMIAIDDCLPGDGVRGSVICCVACTAGRSLLRDKSLSDDSDGTPGLKSEPIPAPCP